MSKKVYFVSDFHLGTPGKTTSAVREQTIVRWLKSIAADMSALYLVGDVFDYWFEYKCVIPKGYVRIFGMLATLRDAGIPIYFFTGNHDMWMFRYFEEELGIPIYRQPIEINIDNKNFYIGHGDGLGPKDHGYKMIKKLFSNTIAQKLYSFVHPDVGIPLMRYFSTKSRDFNNENEFHFVPEKEWLVHFCEAHIQSNTVDYFIFGHRHLVIDHLLTNGSSRYINLGEWLHVQSFASWNGTDCTIDFFENQKSFIHGYK